MIPPTEEGASRGAAVGLGGVSAELKIMGFRLVSIECHCYHLHGYSAIERFLNKKPGRGMKAQYPVETH